MSSEEDREANKAKIVEVSGAGLEFLQSYGWFILAGCVVAYFVWRKLQPTVDGVRSRVEARRAAASHDPVRAEQQMSNMYAARQRLQEQHDAQAARHRELSLQKEEEKRQEKIDDWERHQEGKGYKSKTSGAKASQAPADKAVPSASSGVRPRSSRPLRNTEYNPLMGSGGSGAGFRTSRPTSGGG